MLFDKPRVPVHPSVNALLNNHAPLKNCIALLQAIAWLTIAGFCLWALAAVIAIGQIEEVAAKAAALSSIALGAAVTLPGAVLLLFFAQLGKLALEARLDLAKLVEQRKPPIVAEPVKAPR